MNGNIANSLGVLALLGWCMNVGLSRHIASGHVFGLPGLSYLGAGAVLVLFDWLRGKPPPWRSSADRRFWVVGGGAFVMFCVFFFVAIAWSADSTVALSLGLVNYCWPVLILLLMPLFSKCRVRPFRLGVGVALCLAGVGCAMLWGQSFARMAGGAAENWPAFLIMAAAALCWAAYSNLARRWAGNSSGTGWFEIVSGLLLLALWAIAGGPLGFSPALAMPFLLHALVINAACYLLWDYGIRHGDLPLMGALANFLPPGSILFGAWYLGAAVTPGLWLGGILVCAGAMFSRRGVSGA
ncbi:MAG: EamA family transporter [Planctomycetota bacterium]|jgi:drug/metabolite transporter (DMT)-like permease|nr:EamA family transporter [Planctomycetota bacterium]